MPLTIKVTTTDMETGDVISVKLVDHDNHKTRVWLSKHCYWALRNYHSVLTEPVDKDEADD